MKDTYKTYTDPEIERKVEEHTKVSMSAYDKGFQEGKEQMIKECKEMIDNHLADWTERWITKKVTGRTVVELKQLLLKLEAKRK